MNHITKKIPVVDSYFQNEIIDNYRWLEDDLSIETEGWVVNQNLTTLNYLEKRANKTSVDNMLNLLNKVQDAEPSEYDKI